jgi:hypothetical protein
MQKGGVMVRRLMLTMVALAALAMGPACGDDYDIGHLPVCGTEQPGQACQDPNHDPGDPYRMDPAGDTCDGIVDGGYCYPR